MVSVVLELAFEGDWDGLVRLAARWVPSTELERQAQQVVRGRLERIAPAITGPTASGSAKTTTSSCSAEVDGNPNGLDLLAQHGAEIARILRGETTELARSERADVLQASLSYYPNDLVVVGWNAALIYDTPAGAEASLQILEYANSQLLEFRHYDELLDHELASVYRPAQARARASWRAGVWAARPRA